MDDTERRARDRARAKQYYAAHLEESRARARQYYAEHREARIAYTTTWQEAHPERAHEMHLAAGRKWTNRHRAENPEQALSATKARQAQTRAWFRELVAPILEAGCAHCGVKAPTKLDFHHIDPTTKAFPLGRVGYSIHKRERILAELAKCVLLCSICHALHHWATTRRG